MEKHLKGEIENEKSIIIHWSWEYEKGTKQNLEDTQDGEKIKRYKFLIYAIGE